MTKSVSWLHFLRLVQVKFALQSLINNAINRKHRLVSIMLIQRDLYRIVRCCLSRRLECWCDALARPISQPHMKRQLANEHKQEKTFNDRAYNTIVVLLNAPLMDTRNKEYEYMRWEAAGSCGEHKELPLVFVFFRE